MIEQITVPWKKLVTLDTESCTSQPIKMFYDTEYYVVSFIIILNDHLILVGKNNI